MGEITKSEHSIMASQPATSTAPQSASSLSASNASNPANPVLISPSSTNNPAAKGYPVTDFERYYSMQVC